MVKPKDYTEMKKSLIAIIGMLFCLCSCVYELPQIEQNPYRTICEYLPGTAQMEVPGTLTPDELYDWISVSQSGNTATFTLRRNTTGVIRKACFTAPGEENKIIVFQRAHSLDAKVNSSVVSQGKTSVNMKSTFASDFIDDYAGWGLAYSKQNDLSTAVDVPQSAALSADGNVGQITGLEADTDYFVWSYVLSTEGDKIYSSAVALIPPICIGEGADLQKAIDEAKEFAEVRVLGGLTFPAGIKFTNANCNKSISGGWNADFTAQSMDNLTVIDGENVENIRGFNCSDEGDLPLKGSVEISYFEIKNCWNEDHGSAVHVCGGPVTIHNCYIHDNISKKGAIGTREEDYSSDLTVYNCILTNNVAHHHGAVFGFGDGASYDDQCHIVIFNNLIANNVSDKKNGYCAAFLAYNNTDLVFVNNTLYGNANYMDGDVNWPGIRIYGNVRSFVANNIFAGNLISDNVTPMVCRPHPRFFDFCYGTGTIANNIHENDFGVETGLATMIDNQTVELGSSLSNVMANPANGDFTPVGIALGTGTLGKFNYHEKRDNGYYSTIDLKALYQKYDTDLAGNPRVVNGKVDCGCYQSK